MILMWILFFRVVIADPYDRFRPSFAEAVIPNDRTLHEISPTPDWRTPYADGRSDLPRKRQPLSDSRSGFTHNRPPSAYRVPNVPRGVPRYLQAPYVSGARARLEQTRASYRLNGQPTSPPRLREFPFAGSPEARRVQKRRAFPMHNTGSPDFNRLTAPQNGRMNRFTVSVRPEPSRGAGYRRTRLPTEPTRRGATLSRINLDIAMASPRRRGQAWYRDQSERQGNPVLRSLALTRPSRGNIAPVQTFPTYVSYSYYNTKTSGSPRVGNNAYTQRKRVLPSARSMISGNRVIKNPQNKMSLSAFHAQSEVERNAIQTIQDRHESSDRNNSSYVNISIARDIFADFNNGQHGKSSLKYINTHYPIFRTTSLLKMRIQKEINEQSVKKGKRKDNESDWLKGLWNNLTPNNSTYEDVNGNKVINSLIFNNNFANPQKGATINSSKVNVENQLIIGNTVFEGNRIGNEGFALNPSASERFTNKTPTSDLFRPNMHTKNITAADTDASNAIFDTANVTDLWETMVDTTRNVYKSNIPKDTSTNADISNTKVDTVSKTNLSNTKLESASNIYNLNTLVDTEMTIDNTNIIVETGTNKDTLNTNVYTATNISNKQVDSGANIDNLNTLVVSGTNIEENFNTLVGTGTNIDNFNTLVDTGTNIGNFNTLVDTGTNIDNFNTLVDTGTSMDNLNILFDTGTNMNKFNTPIDTGTNIDNLNTPVDTGTNINNYNTIVDSGTSMGNFNTLVDTGTNMDNFTELVDNGTNMDNFNTLVDTGTNMDNLNTLVYTGTNMDNLNTLVDTGTNMDNLNTLVDTGTNIDNFNTLILERTWTI
ncbi:hypothetical protein MAR_002981 [Mya arenaria]|uniref:Uncharacterized protein n=1 Tax=Mya arenaria TaxID=6604 RepID=A0ABY7G4P3_MYAAR|nr:hypothetical protein MAR_002981 [Mya arenaria]